MKKQIRNLMLATAMGVSAPACFPTGCFVSRVRVNTPDGPRPIDELKPGDTVWSWDTETGALVTRGVLKTLRTHAQVVCRLELGDATIAGVTPSHPFYDMDEGAFKALRDLPRDAPLARLRDGALRAVSVADLHITEHPDPRTPVFNLEVEGPEHNYFAEGILVHNKSPIIIHDGPDVFEHGGGTVTVCDGWTYQGETTCGATDVQWSPETDQGPSPEVVSDVPSTPDGQDQGEGPD